MPFRFPGKDPLMESQEWKDFPTTFNTVLRERLGPSLSPQKRASSNTAEYPSGPLAIGS